MTELKTGGGRESPDMNYFDWQCGHEPRLCNHNTIKQLKPNENRITTSSFCLEKITGCRWSVIIIISKLWHFLFKSTKIWPYQCCNLVFRYALTFVVEQMQNWEK